MLRKCLRFSCLLICAIALLCAKPPPLTPQSTKATVEEILKAHVCHRELTKELLARAFANFLEELDPAKTYLLDAAIIPWQSPTGELLQAALDDYRNGGFSAFFEMHALMVSAIQARQSLEEELMGSQLPDDVNSLEFKDLKWAESKESLKERILRLKALQIKTAEKVLAKGHEHFLKRLEKRRTTRETRLMGSSPKEREQIALVYALKAISSALDSQTLYFTPSEASTFMIQVQQKLYGIGAQLRDDLDGLTIVRLLEGGPALAHAKLKEGDKIIAVDREPVMGMEIDEAVSLIRGPMGSKVTLTLMRNGENGLAEDPFDIEITRGEVVLKDARIETMLEPYGDGMIAIVHLFGFYHDGKNSSASDLAKALEDAKKKYRVKGVILDLRNNGGGQLQQAVAVTGLFISPGVVVSIKDNTDKVQRLRHTEERRAWKGPLVVLTNRLSASAAEIVAQTLQEYGRALVVGDEETFGKGTFQTFTLESSNFGKINAKGEYKVTRGRYYTVSGKSPQLVGVKADIVVPSAFSTMEIGEKYAKFPVGTDEIAPAFDDDLVDVSPLYRIQLEHYYSAHKQTVSTMYQPYVAQLKKNSSTRIEHNLDYSALLNKKSDAEEGIKSYGENDLQLQEAVNVMKDLIFLQRDCKS